MAREVKIPELGEGVDEAQVLSVMVSEGDTIEEEQPLLGIESDKATTELPSPAAGTVTSIRVQEGDTIHVGDVVIELDGNGSDSKPSSDAPGDQEIDDETSEEADERPARAETKEESETSEGGEKLENGATRREEKEPATTEEKEPATTKSRSESSAEGAEEEKPKESVEASSRARPAAASPLVRRLARELGLDVDEVPGHGPGGRVTESDVKREARRRISGGGAAKSAVLDTEPDLPDFGEFGNVERIPLRGIRRAVARSVSVSWRRIPHVTQTDRADVTELERGRRRHRERVEASGGSLSLTAVVIKVVARAARVFPAFNASLDLANDEIVRKKYVHVGVAVDTKHGLVAPVVRDADRKSLTEIGAELVDLSERARERRLDEDAMKGASITVTNLGGLGTRSFTPIVAWPEVAIVGVGQAETRPVYAGPRLVEQTPGAPASGVFVPRLVLPLAISYDHRAVDGADAARFLRWIAEALESPLLLSI